MLVDGLLYGKLIKGFAPATDPLLLSTATIFVPSRRAARELTVSFLKRLKKSGSVILPKIRTLGDVTDEEFGLAYDASEFASLPDAISPMTRKLELANLVMHWVDTLEARTRAIYGDEEIWIPSSRSDALYLADELCALMSQIVQEEVQWKDIQAIIPEDHAEWWRLTTTFLKIIAESWPQFLKERNLVDPVERTAELLRLRAEKYEKAITNDPVIIAGSTGSVPSTLRLLKAVSRMANGAVVLPGLDKTLDKNEWNRLANTLPSDEPAIETHPQFGLAQLLRSLQLTPDNVRELASDHESQKPQNSQKLVSIALSPSEETADWINVLKGFGNDEIEDAFRHVTLIQSDNERSEALAIAIAMREVLETEDKTAALVTPDRNLAERVATELRRFNITVDDTGGTPLANTRPAVFLRLLAKLVFGDAGNADLATFLKSSFCLSGMGTSTARHLGELVELVGLRGVINPVKFGALVSGLSRRRNELEEAKFIPDAIKAMTDDEWTTLLDYAENLDRIISPLSDINERAGDPKIAEIFLRLQAVLVDLSTDANGNSNFYNSPGGVELRDFFHELVEQVNSSFLVECQDIPSVVDALLSGITIRPRGNTHPRLHIMGPLEIRLLDHDRVILGGLNEGTWPQTTRSNAFLNRSIMHELGMASPERRTGLAAHDFQQLMGKSEVFLTRSERVDKSPTVASRWVQRLTALIGRTEARKLADRGNRYLSFAKELDVSADAGARIKPPCPSPPVEARPSKLAVTEIETWIRDPYALYAKKILRLSPMEPLEREPDAMLKGTLYHRIMQDYTESKPLKLDQEDRLKLLCEIAHENITDENLSADITRIWILRFEEIATLYIEWETGYHATRADIETYSEFEGQSHLCDGSFTLTARADRIDVDSTGMANLFDYKTGGTPSASQARTLSPQLALEGLIARTNGFHDIKTSLVNDLVYIRLRRGEDFKAEQIAKDDISVDDIITNAERELVKLVKAFQQESQVYVSRRAPFKEGDISGDYDHLARTREWSFGQEDNGDG